MKAILTRLPSTLNQTLGEFELFDSKGICVFKCLTLELPWLNNMVQKSCIPKGQYNVVRRVSSKYGTHYHVQDVPGRSWILIHVGNYHTDILGCILVGETFHDLNKDGEKDVTASRKTLSTLLSIAPKGFTLIIR